MILIRFFNFVCFFFLFLKNEVMILGNNVSKFFKRDFNFCKISVNGFVIGFLEKIMFKVLIFNLILCFKFIDRLLESLFRFLNFVWKFFEKERLIFLIFNLVFLIKFCCMMFFILLLNLLGLLIKEVK